MNTYIHLHKNVPSSKLKLGDSLDQQKMDKDGGIVTQCKTQHKNNKKPNYCYCYMQTMWMKKKLEQNNTHGMILFI